MSYKEEGTFFYYLALLIGMTLIGSYLWIILTVAPIDPSYQYVIFMSGVLLVVSTLGIAYANTRSGRIGLTMLSGIFAGVHGYLDITQYTDLAGILLFAWLAFGLLLAYAAFSWLRE
ncbi:MAG: hypothetical protein ACE5H4_08165 [Candidatus Thorarchaeota archaeon]